MKAEKTYPYYTGEIDVFGSEIIEFEPSEPDDEPVGSIRLVSDMRANTAKSFINEVKQMHENIDEVILKDGTHIKGEDLMEEGGAVGQGDYVTVKGKKGVYYVVGIHENNATIQNINDTRMSYNADIDKLSVVQKNRNQDYVAVHESKDGYWTIASKPTTKEIANEMLAGTPKGEVGKVVTLQEARDHKKVLGKEYLYAQGSSIKDHAKKIIAGRGWGNYTKGKKLTGKDIPHIKKGEILLNENTQFGKPLRNTYRVIMTNIYPAKDQVIHVEYINEPVSKGGHEIAVWDFEMDSKDSHWYKAEGQNYHPKKSKKTMRERAMSMKNGGEIDNNEKFNYKYKEGEILTDTPQEHKRNKLSFGGKRHYYVVVKKVSDYSVDMNGNKTYYPAYWVHSTIGFPGGEGTGSFKVAESDVIPADVSKEDLEKVKQRYTGLIDIGKRWGSASEYEKTLKEIQSFYSNKFSHGGAIENQYEHKTPNEVWTEWTPPQRMHFLADHKEDILTDAKSEQYKIDDNLSHYLQFNYSQLPKVIQDNIFLHIDFGQYKDGAGIRYTPKHMRKWNPKFPQKGREGMFQGADVRVNQIKDGNVYFNELDKNGVAGDAGVASLDNFRNSFAPWEPKEDDWKKMQGGGQVSMSEKAKRMKYGPPIRSEKGKAKIEKVMKEFKEGKLKSHGVKVTDRTQAIAIGLSEARAQEHKMVSGGSIYELSDSERKALQSYKGGEKFTKEQRELYRKLDDKIHQLYAFYSDAQDENNKNEMERINTEIKKVENDIHKLERG